MEKVAKYLKLSFKMRDMNIKNIKNYINKKIPVILLIQAWPGRKVKNWKNCWQDGHYVVAIGYDSKKIYFEDPSAFLRTYLGYKELEKRWHDIDSSKNKKYYNLGIIIRGPRIKYNSKKLIHMD